jgi:hypothetical protein
MYTYTMICNSMIIHTICYIYIHFIHMKIFISILYKHYIINSTGLYMDSLWKPNIIGGFSNLVSDTAYTSYLCSMQRMTWNSHGIILGHWAWPTKYREFDLDCQQSPPPHIKTPPRNHGSVEVVTYIWDHPTEWDWLDVTPARTKMNQVSFLPAVVQFWLPPSSSPEHSGVGQGTCSLQLWMVIPL